MVSVVVPALDCADEVDGFVDAISRQRYPVERRELIVVDNGSTDATVARLKARGIEAAASPERGRSRALNVGIAQATSRTAPAFAWRRPVWPRADPPGSDRNR